MTPFGGNDAYNNTCNSDTPYPITSAESVPSLISNLTLALYGEIQKDVSQGKVVWIIPCDPNNTATVGGITRNTGEGLMCYMMRVFALALYGGVRLPSFASDSAAAAGGVILYGFYQNAGVVRQRLI